MSPQCHPIQRCYGLPHFDFGLDVSYHLGLTNSATDSTKQGLMLQRLRKIESQLNLLYGFWNSPNNHSGPDFDIRFSGKLRTGLFPRSLSFLLFLLRCVMLPANPPEKWVLTTQQTGRFNRDLGPRSFFSPTDYPMDHPRDHAICPIIQVFLLIIQLFHNLDNLRI